MALAYDAVSIRNAMLDTITTRAGNAALLRFYDGTRPATAGAATNLLATLTCGTPFAGAAAAGVLTLSAITGANASATGTTTWFRIVKADGSTFVMDGNVGTSGSDLNMTTTSFVSGQPVAVSSFVVTEGNP